MIGRREILGGLAVALTAPAALGQSTARPRRLGVLRPGRRPLGDDAQVAGIARALRDLGYVDGQNLVIDARYGEGAFERLTPMARELLDAKADILLAVGSAAALAAREASKTTPILMYANVDPVALGLADRLGKPLGNVTGVLISPDGSLAAKRLSLLREAVPKAKRFGLLAPESDPNFALQIQETAKAAEAAEVSLTVVTVQGRDYRKAFDSIAESGVEALVIGAHQFFNQDQDRQEIIALAALRRLPTMWEWGLQAREGGLMSYGADLAERHQRVANYIDRLLKGAKPSDLPFEQPAALRMALNLKTAAAIGLRLPGGAGAGVRPGEGHGGWAAGVIECMLSAPTADADHL